MQTKNQGPQAAKTALTHACMTIHQALPPKDSAQPAFTQHIVHIEGHIEGT